MVSPTVMAWVKRKLAEPTTIHGVSVLCALASGLAAWYSTKSIPEAVTATGGAYSFVAIAMHDKSGDRSSIEQLMSDAMTAVAQKRLEVMLPKLVTDAQAVFETNVTAVAVPVAPVAVVTAQPTSVVVEPAAVVPAAPAQPGA